MSKKEPKKGTPKPACPDGFPIRQVQKRSRLCRFSRCWTGRIGRLL